MIWQLIKDNFTLIFYIGVILFVFLNRKKFEIQSKIIAIYKTKIGLSLMKKLGRKHKKLIQLMGLIGIGVCFLGMLFISYMFIRSPFDIIQKPAGQAGAAPILPGVNIPGSPIFIPLISGWLALFIIMIVHEFSHGVVAVSHGVKIKSSGIAFLGPILGAFVEPDEDQIKKQQDHVKYSIFAAGPFSNILLFVVVLGFSTLLVSPAMAQISGTGLTFSEVLPGTPAQRAGLEPGMVIRQIQGVEITNYTVFSRQLDKIKPNQEITLTTDKESFTFTAAEHPDFEGSAYIGIKDIRAPLKEKYSFLAPIRPLLSYFTRFLNILMLLSLAIGLGNLLPLPIVDGGRMLIVAISSIHKDKAEKVWGKVAAFFIILLIINIGLTLLKGVGWLNFI